MNAAAIRKESPLERIGKALPITDMTEAIIPPVTQASPTLNNMGIWQQMEREGRVTHDLPVEKAEWSPVDLITAPIGAPGLQAKAAEMLLDAPKAIAINRLFDLIDRGGN